MFVLLENLTRQSHFCHHNLFGMHLLRFPELVVTEKFDNKKIKVTMTGFYVCVCNIGLVNENKIA